MILVKHVFDSWKGGCGSHIVFFFFLSWFGLLSTVRWKRMAPVRSIQLFQRVVWPSKSQRSFRVREIIIIMIRGTGPDQTGLPCLSDRKYNTWTGLDNKPLKRIGFFRTSLTVVPTSRESWITTDRAHENPKSVIGSVGFRVDAPCPHDWRWYDLCDRNDGNKFIWLVWFGIFLFRFEIGLELDSQAINPTLGMRIEDGNWHSILFIQLWQEIMK